LHLGLAIPDSKAGAKLFTPFALPCQLKNSLTLGCPQPVGGFVSADIAGNALAGREGGTKHCRAEIDSKFHATPPFIKRGASLNHTGFGGARWGWDPSTALPTDLFWRRRLEQSVQLA
jgi:hypothetical protein